MTLVDSVDAILMLYSYSGFPDRSWAIFEKAIVPEDGDIFQVPGNTAQGNPSVQEVSPPALEEGIQEISRTEQEPPDAPEETKVPKNSELRSLCLARDLRVKKNTMSGLSIVLTLMSILVAFRFVFVVSPVKCSDGPSY